MKKFPYVSSVFRVEDGSESFIRIIYSLFEPSEKKILIYLSMWDKQDWVYTNAVWTRIFVSAI